MKKLGWTLITVGIVLLVFIPVWNYVIMPPQLVMPEDVDESISYTGQASMANPADLEHLLGPFDLTINRTYKGIDTVNDGEALIINETAEITINSPLSPPITEQFMLAVDRRSYEHLPEDGDGWDHARSGRFTFGLHPEKEDIEFWLHDINDTVIAEYSGTTTYKGINVIKYEMNQEGPVLKNQELITMYASMAYYYSNSALNALYFKEDSQVYVDEISGIILYIDRNIEFNGNLTNMHTNETYDAVFSKMSYEFDDATTDRLVKDAKEADAQLTLFEITIPIALFGLGIIFAIAGILSQIRSGKKNETNGILKEHS